MPAEELAQSGGSKYVEVLKKLGARFPNRPFNLIYLDASAQFAFVEKLGGNPSDVGLVAFNPRKSRIANYYGVFAEESVAEFLDGLVTGSVSTAPLSQLPPLAAVDGAAAAQEAQPSCSSPSSSSASSEGKCTAPPKKDEL
jgi:hypothetical protein